MRKILQNFRKLRQRLTGLGEPSVNTGHKEEAPSGMTTGEEIEYWHNRRRKEWLETMLPRVAEHSQNFAETVNVPNPSFHGSPYPGTSEFDPALGQGLGVWFQPDFEEAVDFAVSRCRYLDTATPVVYEVTLNPRNTAIFPTETELYMLAIKRPGDVEGSGSPFSLHEVREILTNAGFDSIYLQDRNTISALESKIITIIAEHHALPVFNERVRPQLERNLGEHFAGVYDFLHKLKM